MIILYQNDKFFRELNTNKNSFIRDIYISIFIRTNKMEQKNEKT